MRDFIQRRKELALSKSAGGFQAALVDAGLVKQSQVDAVRKEERDPDHRFYLAHVHVDVLNTLTMLLDTRRGIFNEKRLLDDYQDWCELETMIAIEKAYVNPRTHSFVCHLVGAFVAKAKDVKLPQGPIPARSVDPITRIFLTHTAKVLDPKVLQALQSQPLDSPQFQKAFKQACETPKLARCSPISTTLVSVTTFEALKRWAQLQQLLETKAILRILTR